MSEFKGTPGPWHVGYGITGIGCTNAKIGGHAKLFDVRGWGYFTGDGHGGLGLSYEEAMAIQKANACLVAAAPDLLESQTMGIQLNTPDFLDWIAERLVNVYGESPHVDFVVSLKDRAAAGRAAIAKALGETK